jgi:Fe-S cluster assembly protein SufD
MIEQLKSDFNKMTENLKFSENNVEFRKKNLTNFIDKGFPNKRIEDWKFKFL